MAETNEGTQGQESGGTQEQQYTPPSREEWEGAQTQIRELRKESGNYRTSLRTAEDNLKRFENGATAEDVQKLRTENAQAIERLTAAEARALNSDIKAEAVRAGFKDPDDALRFLDRDALKIKDGEATNVGDLLKDLAKNKPYLLAGATATVDGGAVGGAVQPTMNDIIRTGMRRGR